ncbi:hypothetical protein Q2941_51330 [Bradyrhizobium sp. UFLA05-153]
MQVVEGTTGEVRTAQIFVAVLGASNYTYAEASSSQSLPDWIASHVRAFSYFGGAARQTVSDNLKAGITGSAFMSRWSTGPMPISPAISAPPSSRRARIVRARYPNRRAMDSGAPTQPPSLAALNEAIRPLLVDLNNRPLRIWGRSRRELFEELERPALIPLPDEPYENAEWKRCRVNLDYLVEIAQHYYSVPHNLVHEEVEAGSPRKRSRFSCGASASPRICAAFCRIAQRRSPSICRARIAATATGPMSAFAPKPPR